MKSFDALLSAATVVFTVYVVVILTLPFSVYVDIRSTTYHDVCVGSSTQTVSNDRTPIWAIPGDAFAQVVRFEDQSITETTIIRTASFGYEPGDFARFEIEWDTPFETTGTYGVNEWITINPLPLAKVNTLRPAEDHKFNVINCI